MTDAPVIVQSVKPIPRDYPGVCPYISVRDPAAAIEFYKKAFKAKERYRLTAKDGSIAHAEIAIGKAVIMLSGEWPDMNFKAPDPAAPISVSLCIYVKDVDALSAKAAKAGATILQPPADKFYGDRAVQLRDPFGHVWSFMTRVRNVSAAEMQAAMDTM